MYKGYIPVVTFKSPFSHGEASWGSWRGKALTRERVSAARGGGGCDQKEFQISCNNHFGLCSCFSRAPAMQTAMWRYGLGYELPTCQQFKGSQHCFCLLYIRDMVAKEKQVLSIYQEGWGVKTTWAANIWYTRLNLNKLCAHPIGCGHFDPCTTWVWNR